MLTERAVGTLIDMGIENFEVFFNTSSELEKSYVKMLSKAFKRNGCNVFSIHPYSSSIEPFMFFSDYERRFTDMLDTYKQYFDAAEKFGAKVLVIHGDKMPGHVPDEKYIERFHRIAECGKEMGVTVCQENVNLYRSHNPDFLLKMKKQLGEYGKFVFDIKQSIRSGYDPYEFISKIADSIVHVHCSDHNSMRDCMLPGQGDTDFFRLKEIFERCGNSPTWVIEVYRRNFDKITELKDSFDYLNGLLGN